MERFVVALFGRLHSLVSLGHRRIGLVLLDMNTG